MDTIMVEEVIAAPIEQVWDAITSAEKVRRWFFNIDAFAAIPGYKFQFLAGANGKEYLHLCEVTDAVKPGLLAYTWKFKDVPGVSIVSFRLSPAGSGTLVTLTHTGLQNFPETNTDLAPENFLKGWNHIIKTSLKNFLEQ